MKTFMWGGVLFLLILCISCQNATPSTADPTTAFKSQPVSIFNGDSTSQTIQSYQAHVRTYYSHNRKGNIMEPQNDYTISMKIIGGKLYTRVDLPAKSFGDNKARSVLSNEKETIVCQTIGGIVESRSPLPEIVNRLKFADMVPNLNGRVDLETLKTKARALLLDVSESNTGIVTISVPSSMFGNSVKRYNLNYDAKNQTLVNGILETTQPNGATVITTSYPMYQEKDGSMVKVGEVKTVETKFNYKLNTSDSVVKPYANSNEVPTITKAELEKLQAEGKISKQETPIQFGDPSDPNYTETFLDNYEDVKLNTVPDSYFKLAL